MYIDKGRLHLERKQIQGRKIWNDITKKTTKEHSAQKRDIY